MTPRLETFRARWIDPQSAGCFWPPPRGRPLGAAHSTLEDMAAYDLYDVLGELGYGLNRAPALDRRLQPSPYKHAAWLRRPSAPLRATLEAWRPVRIIRHRKARKPRDLSHAQW